MLDPGDGNQRIHKYLLATTLHASGDKIFCFGGNQTKLHQILLSEAAARAMASVHYRWAKGYPQ